MSCFRSNKLCAENNNSRKMKGCKRENADNQPKSPRPGKNPQKHVIQTCTHRWEGEERCSP